MYEIIGLKAYLTGQQRAKETTEIPYDAEITLFPSPPKAKTDTAWPEKIGQLFADIQDAMNEGKSPIMIVSNTRTVLETCLKNLGGTGSTNYDRIKSLQTSGVLTEPIADWAHDLRRFGNDATHDAEATRQDAVAFVEFMIQFMTVAFSLPAQIQRRRDEAAGTAATD